MRRLLLVGVLSCVGCLEPGKAPLGPRDTTPPRVVSTQPAAGGTVPSTGTLQVVFSEAMDERTLRPGIAVFEGRAEVPLVVKVPPELEGGEEEHGDVPSTITLSPEAGAWKASTAYTLVLRTSLTDFEGNALGQEVRVTFRTEP